MKEKKLGRGREWKGDPVRKVHDGMAAQEAVPVREEGAGERFRRRGHREFIGAGRFGLHS